MACSLCGQAFLLRSLHFFTVRYFSEKYFMKSIDKSRNTRNFASRKKIKDMATIAEQIKKMAQEQELTGAYKVTKYTTSGKVEKPFDTIIEWIDNFPHLIRAYSPKSGRFLTATSLYRIEQK